MASILIESVPEALHAAIAQTAAEHSRTISQEALALLEGAVARKKQTSDPEVVEATLAWGKGDFDPDYEASLRAGELGGGTDSAILVSEMRDEPPAPGTPPAAPAEPKRQTYWANRKLLPEFAALRQAGRLRGGTDSTDIISEERDAR